VFHLSVQRASGDFQCFSDQREIAAASLDRLQDRLPLGILKTAASIEHQVFHWRSTRRPNFLRQVTAHVALGGHEGEAFDQVSELADIAGPVVVAQRGTGFGLDGQGLDAVFGGEQVVEVVDQPVDVAGAFAQGRRG